MAEFYDQAVFGVRRLRPRDKQDWIDWEIITPQGACIAYMRASKVQFKHALLKAINFKACFPASVDILGSKESVMIRIEKPFLTTDWQVDIKDENGQLVGIMTRHAIPKAVEKDTLEYRVSDPNKVVIGSLKGNWRTNTLQMHDEKGSIIGKINRRDQAVNPAVFQMGQRYHIVQMYFPPKTKEKRMALLGAAAAIDVLVD